MAMVHTLPLFPALENELASLPKRKPRKRHRVEKRLLSESFENAQLDLFLFGSASVANHDKDITWTEEDVRKMFTGFLRRSLQILADPRTSKPFKEEVIVWMKAPYYGQPFAYAVCCRVAGVDPEDLLNGVYYNLRKLRGYTE